MLAPARIFDRFSFQHLTVKQPGRAVGQDDSGPFLAEPSGRRPDQEFHRSDVLEAMDTRKTPRQTLGSLRGKRLPFTQSVRQETAERQGAAGGAPPRGAEAISLRGLEQFAYHGAPPFPFARRRNRPGARSRKFRLIAVVALQYCMSQMSDSDGPRPPS